MVSKELELESIIVFDEAHNIVMSKKRPCSSFDKLEGDLLSTVCSTCSSSSLGSVTRSSNVDKDIDDFECKYGISDALQKYKPVSITVQRLKSNFFSPCFNGKQHPTLLMESAYQYCHHQY